MSRESFVGPLVELGMMWCSSCKRIKKLPEDFHRNASSKHGWANECKRMP